MPSNSAPKKIVYVENGIGYGGAIICLRHLVRKLDRDRFLPLVVTGRNGPQYQEIADEAIWKHIPDRHIDIISWRAKAESIHWLNKVPPLRFLITQLIARSDDLFNFLPFFICLLWTSWHVKADLIHANNEPLCNRAALMVAKILRIPCISHVRGDPINSRLGRWAYSLPDHFISVSHWVANTMQHRLGIPTEKISVVYDGIALEKLNKQADGAQFRQRFDIQEKDFAVGLVGLLIPWKGQRIFIDAAKLLKAQIPQLKMLIVGGTPDDCVDYERELKQRVTQENLTDTVVFTGHVSDMMSVYKGLDIVVSASTSPEPLGTVVIEAMAMACALIVPNHGGGAEMVEHEQTGLIFSSGDPQSLADTILKFQKSKQLMQSLAQNAQNKALMTFDVQQHTDAVQTIYQKLL
jgi:glycosyltransferase involved in cell wall biosynthesis